MPSTLSEEYQEEEIEEVEPDSDEEPEKGKPSRHQREIESATEADDLPTLIRLVNLRVSPVDFALRANPPIAVPLFLAIRKQVLGDMFAERPERIWEKNKKTLRGSLFEVRNSPDYLRIKGWIEGAIEYVWGVDGVSSVAKKFEPQIARAMAAEAFSGGREGGKVLLDLADRAAPKPQRQNTNKVVYVLPGGHESLEEARQLAEGMISGDDDGIDGSVLNVPRGVIEVKPS